MISLLSSSPAISIIFLVFSLRRVYEMKDYGEIMMVVTKK